MTNSCQHCNYTDSHRYTLSIYRPDDARSLCRELRLCRICGREFERDIEQVFRKFNQYPPTTDSGGRSDQ